MNLQGSLDSPPGPNFGVRTIKYQLYDVSYAQLHMSFYDSDSLLTLTLTLTLRNTRYTS